MIQYYQIGGESRVKPCQSAQNCNWIHLSAPTEEEMLDLSESYAFPIDYLHSTLDPDEVSRAEEIEQETLQKGALISLLYPREDLSKQNQGAYLNRTISVILLKDAVVTCVRETPEFLSRIQAGNFELVHESLDPQSLLLEITWQVSRAYVYASRDITERMNLIHSKLGKSTKSELLLHLAELDKSTIYLATAVQENHPIIEEYMAAPYLLIDPYHRAWIHDIQVENHQAEKMLDQTKQMLQQLDTTFSSIISNNLNETMKTLTSFTIILTVPTITAGIWGMNVGLPFEHEPLAFVLVMLVTFLFMVILFIWLKHKDFL